MLLNIQFWFVSLLHILLSVLGEVCIIWLGSKWWPERALVVELCGNILPNFGGYIEGDYFRAENIINNSNDTANMEQLTKSNIIQYVENPTARLMIINSKVLNLIDEIPSFSKTISDTLLTFFKILMEESDSEEKIYLACKTRMIYTLCELINKGEV